MTNNDSMVNGFFVWGFLEKCVQKLMSTVTSSWVPTKEPENQVIDFKPSWLRCNSTIAAGGRFDRRPRDKESPVQHKNSNRKFTPFNFVRKLNTFTFTYYACLNAFGIIKYSQTCLTFMEIAYAVIHTHTMSWVGCHWRITTNHWRLQQNGAGDGDAKQIGVEIQ